MPAPFEFSSTTHSFSGNTLTMMVRKDPTERFSDRVDNYVKFRPTYPDDVIRLLTTEVGLRSEMTVADVGSGTGILTSLLLKNGNTVFSVEPNEAMRIVAETQFSGVRNFKSLSGRSEATTLQDHGMDFVFAAQAFHWFDPIKTKVEFKRILRNFGQVVIIWNDRDTSLPGLNQKYEDMLDRFGNDYDLIKKSRRLEGPVLETFFGANSLGEKNLRLRKFSNHQDLDWASFKGRLLSSSYCPSHGDLHFEEIVKTLRLIFDEFKKGDVVRMEYVTKVYYGPLD